MSDLPVFGAGIWHFATYVDRYATEGYGEPVGLIEQIDLAGAVGDLSVVDLNWPFAGFDGTLDDVRAALARNNLRAIAITPEIYNKDYIKGSITNPDPAVRAQALALLHEATARIMAALVADLEALRGERAPGIRFDPRAQGVTPIGKPRPLKEAS